LEKFVELGKLNKMVYSFHQVVTKNYNFLLEMSLDFLSIIVYTFV